MRARVWVVSTAPASPQTTLPTKRRDTSSWFPRSTPLAGLARGLLPGQIPAAGRLQGPSAVPRREAAPPPRFRATRRLPPSPPPPLPPACLSRPPPWPAVKLVFVRNGPSLGVRLAERRGDGQAVPAGGGRRKAAGAGRGRCRRRKAGRGRGRWGPRGQEAQEGACLHSRQAHCASVSPGDGACV